MVPFQVTASPSCVMLTPWPSPKIEPSRPITDVYVPSPVVATPSMWPLSSNVTSTVVGSVEVTRLTSRLPLLSPICSPIIHRPLFAEPLRAGLGLAHSTPHARYASAGPIHIDRSLSVGR